MIVAEGAVIFPRELCYAVVGSQCRVVPEGLAHFDLHGVVAWFWLVVGVGFAIAVDAPAKCSALTRHVAISEVSAVWKQRPARSSPRVRVDRREASAPGRSGAAVCGVETVELVVGDKGCWIAAGIKASRREGRSVCCNGPTYTKYDFLGIDEDILRRVAVADEVVEAATIEAECVELLDGDAALVFHDAL